MYNIHPNPLRGYDRWLADDEKAEAIERIKDDVYSDIQDGKYKEEIEEIILDHSDALTAAITKHIAYEYGDKPLTINSELADIRKAIEAWAYREAEERYEKDCKQAARDHQDYLAEQYA